MRGRVSTGTGAGTGGGGGKLTRVQESGWERGVQEGRADALEVDLWAKLERRVNDLSRRPKAFVGPTRQDAPFVNAHPCARPREPTGASHRSP